MWLEKIQIEGVRNLEDTELVFDKNVNYIFGNNGAGKTSILEAIHFLAVGRSFRTNRDNEIIKFNAPFLKISGLAYDTTDERQPLNTQRTQNKKFISVNSVPSVVKDTEISEGEIRLDNGTKTAFLQHQKQEKLSSYLGWLPVVTILLSDIELVSGAPQRRRNFIDLAISKISKNYLRNLIEYRQVLLQRNKLLQEKAEQALYEVWEMALVKYGSEIYQERQKIVPMLITEAQKFYSVFIPDRQIAFEYRTDLDNFEGKTTSQEKFLSLLKTNRVKEQELGYTIIGPHRDDISIQEQTLPVRKFGSEGEQRLAALSLKMAEAELLAKNKRRPIFLLDEVASELDTTNTKKLFDLIQGQFFYATAKASFASPIIKSINNGKFLNVENGKIKKIETFG